MLYCCFLPSTYQHSLAEPSGKPRTPRSSCSPMTIGQLILPESMCYLAPGINYYTNYYKVPRSFGS